MSKNPLLDTLLEQLPEFQHAQTHLETGQISVWLASNQASSNCPLCNTSSASIHSTYQRTLASLPANSSVVTLELPVRRFRCHSPDCARAVFREQFQHVIASYARRTRAQTETLCSIGFALGGNAGSRLGQRLGVNARASTLLRIVHHTPEPQLSTAKVIGVDDFLALTAAPS